MSGLIDYYARRRRAQTDKEPDPVKYPSWDPSAVENMPDELPPEAAAAATAPTNGHVRNVRPVPRSRRKPTSKDSEPESPPASTNGNDALHEADGPHAPDAAGVNRAYEPPPTELHFPFGPLAAATADSVTDAGLAPEQTTVTEDHTTGDHPALEEPTVAEDHTTGDHPALEEPTVAEDHTTGDHPALEEQDDPVYDESPTTELRALSVEAIAEPDVAQAAEPQAAEPDVAEPKAQTAEAQAAELDAAEAEPEPAEPQAPEPDMAEPEPEAAEPDVVAEPAGHTSIQWPPRRPEPTEQAPPAEPTVTVEPPAEPAPPPAEPSPAPTAAVATAPAGTPDRPEPSLPETAEPARPGLINWLGGKSSRLGPAPAPAPEATTPPAPAPAPEATTPPAPAPAPPPTFAPAPAPAPTPAPLGFRERGRLRRRARYLRHVREVQLRNLGGFVLELHRFEVWRGDLVGVKVAEAAETDRELRALEKVLSEQRPLTELREAGIGGTCKRCGTIHGSVDRFCAACGAPLAAPASKAARETRTSAPRGRRAR